MEKTLNVFLDYSSSERIYRTSYYDSNPKFFKTIIINGKKITALNSVKNYANQNGYTNINVTTTKFKNNVGIFFEKNIKL